MSVSKRYECILAVLNDPINRAIVAREIKRRSEEIAPPPVPRVLGGGVVYLTLEEYLSGTKEAVGAEDSHGEVYGVKGEWYAVTGEAEVGPFSSLQQARIEIELLMKEQGITVLQDHPWTESDAEKYPL